ncbi:hypothetical protein QTP88_005802 [Uroleucon formosanum]
MDILDDVKAVCVVYALYKRQKLKQKITTKRKYWVHPLNENIEVIEADDFLSLSSEKVVKLISSDDLSVPSEEKVSKLKLIIVLFQSPVLIRE